MKYTAERMKELREASGESQSELAKAIGVTTMAISKYENGLMVPSDDNKVKIARHYGVSINWLFFNEASKPKVHKEGNEHDTGRDCEGD